MKDRGQLVGGAANPINLVITATFYARGNDSAGIILAIKADWLEIPPDPVV
jgi:hypothetical protein